MDSSNVKRAPLNFFLLVYALSIPFWILGALAPDTTKILPIKLPISALMTFCPLIAAAILIYKKQKTQGVKQLLKQTFDCKKIKNKKWYLPVVFLMPVIALLSFWYMNITGGIAPEPQPSPLSVFIFFFIYFIGAIGEELGWSGYMIGPLQDRYGAFSAGIIAGIVWAVWHIIPWSQAHQSAAWIAWQCIATVFLRVIMVWLFNNTRKSVFAMVLFHTMINISPYLIPNYGAHYDPFIFAVLLISTTIVITFLWGTKTMDEYRYSLTPKKKQ
ncbi:MAG: type II CAAX endopeptidase family protein [Chitinophagaceae bacterium]